MQTHNDLYFSTIGILPYYRGELHFTNVAIGIIVFIVLYVIYIRFLSPLVKIPGPFWACISRLWIVRLSRKGNMHRVMLRLHEKYGKLVRVGPKEVIVADLAAVKTIYGAGTKFRKSDWYSVWQGHRKFDLFAERNEDIHSGQRRLVNNIYSLASLKEFEGKVDKVIKRFMSSMSEKGPEATIDIGKWVQLFAFDVIGEITFSKSFGFLENGTDGGALLQIENALKSAAWVGQVPWFFWLHDFLTPVVGNHLGIAARHGKLREIAAREVARRTGHKGEQKDILAKLFEVGDKKAPQMSHEDILSMSASNVFAGSDTTAISLRSIIYFLLKTPISLSRLMNEIEERKSQGKLSNPAKLDEAMDMPYLQACIYEALRLHPAVGMSLPRVVPEGGTVINGCFLPEGTTVGVNPWVIHRDKSVFGEEVEKFRPERWLSEGNGDMKRFFFAFGGGARLCLGKNISWMEMSKIIPTFFSHFEIQFSEPNTVWKETCSWFVKQEGLVVKLRSRE